jgi:hypothetical protein
VSTELPRPSLSDPGARSKVLGRRGCQLKCSGQPSDRFIEGSPRRQIPRWIPCIRGPATRSCPPEAVYADRVTRSPRLHRYTFDEYLALEASSTVRNEFLAGEIYAMAGGTPEHAALAVAVCSALLAQMRGGPCRVHSSDLRVRALATGLTTHPDVTLCPGLMRQIRRTKTRSSIRACWSKSRQIAPLSWETESFFEGTLA